MFAAASSELNTSAVSEEPPMPITSTRSMPSRGFVSQRINIHRGACAHLRWSAASRGGSSLRPALRGLCPKRRVMHPDAGGDRMLFQRSQTSGQQNQPEVQEKKRRSSSSLQLHASKVVNESAKDLTPSSSNSCVTCCMEIPAAFNSAKNSCASSSPRVMVRLALP